MERPLRKQLMTHLGQLLHQYPLLKGQFQVIDAAFRVAGTGSLGVKRYVLCHNPGSRDRRPPSQMLQQPLFHQRKLRLPAWVNP